MSYYEKISCRIAIQVCIGHFPDGRERHRTFSMRGIDPDAPPESIAAVVRALAPLLAYPITKVRKIVKRIITVYEKGVVPWDEQASQKSQENAEPVAYAGRITERLISRRALPDAPFRNAAVLPQSQTGFFSRRAPPSARQRRRCKFPASSATRIAA